MAIPEGFRGLVVPSLERMTMTMTMTGDGRCKGKENVD